MRLNIQLTPVWRLTIWYVLIIMVISLMFSAVIYQVAVSNLRAGLPSGPAFSEEFGGLYPIPFDYRFGEYIEARYQKAVERLRTTLLVVNLVVLGGSGLASYWLAKRTLRPIEQALEEQRRFTADASHELRTPLTAMKAEIEVALKENDPTEHRRALLSSLEEIDKLGTLAGSLLTLARSQGGERDRLLGPVKLAAVVEAATQRVAMLAKAKQIKLARTVKTGTIIGDEAALVNLLVILLDNAIKYSPAGSAVRIKAEWARYHATVIVADEGVGIPADDLPRVFDRFYRVDAARSKRGAGGFGLGLSIAKQIVDQHHGTIILSSVEGKGTTATITLPNKRS